MATNPMIVLSAVVAFISACTGGRDPLTQPTTTAPTKAFPESSGTASTSPGSAASGPSRDYAGRYVGLRYQVVVDKDGRYVVATAGKPLPGPVLSSTKGGDAPFVYSFEEDREHHMLWLSREVERASANQTALLEVVDAIDLSPPGPNDQVFGACRLRGTEDSEIVAIARLEGDAEPERLVDARLAWRFNRDAEQIEAIPAIGIACSTSSLLGE